MHRRWSYRLPAPREEPEQKAPHRRLWVCLPQKPTVPATAHDTADTQRPLLQTCVPTTKRLSILLTMNSIPLPTHFDGERTCTHHLLNQYRCDPLHPRTTHQRENSHSRSQSTHSQPRTHSRSTLTANSAPPQRRQKAPILRNQPIAPLPSHHRQQSRRLRPTHRQTHLLHRTQTPRRPPSPSTPLPPNRRDRQTSAPQATSFDNPSKQQNRLLNNETSEDSFTKLGCGCQCP